MKIALIADIHANLPALEAVETVAIVINAATGIEPMAERMMDYAASRHLDRLIIVNKIDALGVNLAALLERLRQDGRLSPAILQSHQVMTEDPNHPIRFSFTASWTSAKHATK